MISAITAFEPGTVLGIQFGPILHTVLVTGRGTALHSSKASGCVTEDPLHSVIGNNATVILGKVDYATLWLAEARGRARLGEKWFPWRNCEHFVSEICSGVGRSSQFVFWLAVTAGFAFALFRTR